MCNTRYNLRIISVERTLKFTIQSNLVILSTAVPVQIFQLTNYKDSESKSGRPFVFNKALLILVN